MSSVTPVPARCPACGGSSLTSPTRYITQNGSQGGFLVFQKKGVKASFFGARGKEAHEVDRASACLDCGHVLLVVSPGKLALLRAAMASLEPFVD